MVRFRYGALAALLAFAVAFCAATTRRAVAQSAPAHDTWSHHDDRLATISASISSTAAVVAGVTNKQVNVRAMTLRSDTAGVVTFQDGSGGTTIGQVYLEANKPYTIYEGALGKGLTTSTGNGLYAVLPSATLTAFVRYRAEPD